MNGKRRIVVVGIGFRSPIGNTIDELRNSLHQQRSGIRRMPEWDRIGNLRSKVAGVCEGVDESVVPRRFRRSMGRVGILSALAAQDAIEDSGLETDFIASGQCGISFGSTSGSSQAMEEYLDRVLSTRSLKGLPSSGYLKFMSHTCAANLAVMFNAKGPVIASCTACVSGSQGIGFGCEAIREGRATAMIAGGAEEMHFMDAAVFDVMMATSTKFNDRPDRTPRPFDADRDGLVVAEGAAVLILEDYEHARSRGARIYGEVLGYATNCDGEHLTNPSQDGMFSVMEKALKDADLPPEEIGYVNAHATATEAGDLAESNATNRIFGERVPVSSLKGYMGHTLGACGAIESIATMLMMNEGFIAPTYNLENPDPALASLDHVMGDVRKLDFSVAMNNNFAFGGINTSLILGKA